MRRMLDVAALEFDEGGTTMWVHNAQGITVLRIKAKKIVVKKSCTNAGPHADIQVDDVVEICIPTAKRTNGHRRLRAKAHRTNRAT